MVEWPNIVNQEPETIPRPRDAQLKREPKKTVHRRIEVCRFGSTRERLTKGFYAMLVYPIFAVVAAMSLAGGRVEPLTRAFLVTCVFYPLMYFGSLTAVTTLRRHRKKSAALVVSGFPLQYLGAVSMIGLVTLLVEGMPR